MPRRRRSKRYSLTRPVKLVKYSNETFSFQSLLTYNAGQDLWVLVSKSTDILGVRKAKNFTLNLITAGTIPFLFALVFVPEGTQPSPLAVGTTAEGSVLISNSLYNPNQNVIMQGIIAGFQAGPLRYKTRLARNLNSGDEIVLCIKPLVSFPDTIGIIGTVN